MIQPEIVAEILRKIANHEITPDEKVEWSFCGNILVKAENYTIIIFIDCDEIDYVDSVIAPDGKETKFEEWEKDPIDLLSEDEIVRLEVIFTGEAEIKKTLIERIKYKQWFSEKTKQEWSEKSSEESFLHISNTLVDKGFNVNDILTILGVCYRAAAKEYGYEA